MWGGRFSGHRWRLKPPSRTQPNARRINGHSHQRSAIITIALPLLVLLLTLVGAAAPDRTTAPAAPHFTAVDVYVDPHGKPLAAYQFEITATNATVELVGLEGGEHPAFAAPPYYDTKANLEQRIVVAAFNAGRDLPNARTRVARLMVRVTGDGKPNYTATLQTAASADAAAIPATIDVDEGATP